MEKDRDRATKDKDLLNAFLKILLTHHTPSQAIEKCHNNKAHRIILEKFENHIFLHLKLWKLKLILKNFISISKSFILLSVFYAQPKFPIFGCDNL